MDSGPAPEAPPVPWSTSTAWRRDSWLLALAGISWLPLEPATGIAAALGAGMTLVLCKALTMAPAWRAFIAPIPAFAALSLPGSGRIALAGALAAAAGYLAFTLVRRGVYAFRFYSRYSPDGMRKGLDRGRLLLLRERIHARFRPRRPRRIFCSASAHEAGIRKGFEHCRDIVDFGELDELDELGEQARHYDLIMPLTIPALLRAHELGFAAGNPLPIPSPACIGLCDDKLRFHQELARRGFGELLPPLAATGVFPSVLKKRVDEWGTHSHVLLSADDERRHAGLLEDPAYFRQEFVPGRREYATHLLFRDGRILRALAVEYRFDHDHHVKGPSRPPHDMRVVASRYLDEFSAMLAAIGFEGLCCVNYKLRNGRPQVFEINPRFGASLAPYLYSFLRCVA